MRTRADLDAIRTSNRATLGMAGLGQSSPLDALVGQGGAVRSVRLQTRFPSTDLTWRPGQTAPDAGGQGGSGVPAWVLAHVVQPSAEIETALGTIRIDPYQGQSDYSQLVAAGLVVGGALTALGVAWVIARAFSRRTNPRRIAVRRVSPRLVVYRSVGRRSRRAA